MKDRSKCKTEISLKLVDLREAIGLSIKDVADATGISYDNLRKYETVSRPPDRVIIILAEFFGVTTDYLLGKTDKIYGEDKKITTYNEKESNKNFILNQDTNRIKRTKKMELTDLEVSFLKKLRAISSEDRNDVIRYLNDKEDNKDE